MVELRLIVNLRRLPVVIPVRLTRPQIRDMFELGRKKSARRERGNWQALTRTRLVRILAGLQVEPIPDLSNSQPVSVDKIKSHGGNAMQKFKKILGHLMIMLLVLAVPGLLAAQDSAKQDMKDAGHETKEAAKDTGRATKKVAKKTGHAVKKATHKAAEKTEEGADKVKEKTDPK